MTREEMLDILHDLPFVMIDPGSWEDVGFTEREIWINGKGYGYIMCDELTGTWEGEGLNNTQWERVVSRIADGSLTIQDIKDTSLEEIIDGFYDKDWFSDNPHDLIEELRDLLSFSRGLGSHFYAIQSEDGVLFYDNEKAFRAAYERDWADTEWDELDDGLLSEWLKRLCNEYGLESWAKKHGLCKE